MATRRSRIQIKPNTGPRSSNKDTTEKVSSSPAKPAVVKNYETLPIKEEEDSTSKDVENEIDKSILDSLDQLTIRSAVKSVGKIPSKPVVKVEATQHTVTPPASQNIVPVTGSSDASNTIGNALENYNRKSNNEPKETMDRDQNNKGDASTSKIIAAPPQRTRLRKLLPKVPEARRLPRQGVMAQNNNQTPKDTDKVIETEVQPVSQVSSKETAASTEASPSKEVQSHSSQENVEPTPPDVHVFKKPDEPARRNSISRSNSIAPIVPDKRNGEAEPANKTTSKKSKHKESNKQKATRKQRTEYNVAEPPDKAKMTIMDLIYWNPINNPMKKVKKEEIDKKTSREEGDVDDPNKVTENPTTGAASVEEIVPGPRVIVGEDGQITLDESSLVIEQTAPEKDLSQEVLYETSDTTYTSYSKKIFVRKLWSMRETALFYKALSVVGTDFALMAKFFPKRTRADLKRKFKKEERTRRDLLDKAVCEWHKFDLEDIQDFLFLKSDDAPADDQDLEEAAVDNPENAGPKTINQYVRDNLIGKKAKGKGKRPKKVKEKPKKKGKENAKKPKEKKAAKRPLRDNSSDEEIDPAEEEEMENVCEAQETDANTAQECGDDELCLLQTKTSKRQQTLEAKRRKLDAQQAVMLQAQLKATKPLVCPTSPEPMSDSLSFTVITSKNTTPPNMLLKENPHIRCIASLPSTNSPVANSRITLMKPATATTPGTKTASTPTSQPSTSKAESKDVTVVPRNNVPSASPVLQALLNRSSPITLPMMNIPGASPGQFVLVASKTPTNEQVVHVYLVSPSNAASTSQGASQSQQISTRTHATAEALLRLGITVIPPQPNTESPKEENCSPEKKT